MQLIIGTKNKAKIDQIKSILEPLNFTINGLPDRQFSEVKENGKTAVENARLKATFYASIIGQPVFSMDNALYFDNLEMERQPGLNVRRIEGVTGRPSDDELILYYTKVVKHLGGRINGYWEYGFCLAYPGGETEEISFKSPRIFVSEPSKEIVEGYPLESIQIDPNSGLYISEMSKEQQDNFWRKTIGLKLSEFIKKSRISLFK